MLINDVPAHEDTPSQSNSGSKDNFKFVSIFLILAALIVGELFTVSRMNTLNEQVSQKQNQLREDLTSQLRDQVSNRLSAIEQQNGQELEAVKNELDSASKRVGAQSSELKRARTMVAQLQDQERAQTEQLKDQINQKADAQQVGALTQDLSSTKTDLNTTQKNVSSLAADLGMARSEMGTLIARNHDDIEYLRKIGDHDYFEFTLTRGQQSKVAGVGLTLKRTNFKRHQYTVNTLVDDMDVERKDCSVNSPVYFFVNGSKKPYEMVVNSVSSNQVKGYLSTPKGVTQVASRSEGAQ